jgi:hypothetical protein
MRTRIHTERERMQTNNYLSESALIRLNLREVF